MASKYNQSLLQHFKINYMQDGTLDITVHILANMNHLRNTNHLIITTLKECCMPHLQKINFFNEISSKGVQGHTVLHKKLILHIYATK